MAQPKKTADPPKFAELKTFFTKEIDEIFSHSKDTPFYRFFKGLFDETEWEWLIRPDSKITADILKYPNVLANYPLGPCMRIHMMNLVKDMFYDTHGKAKYNQVQETAIIRSICLLIYLTWGKNWTLLDYSKNPDLQSIASYVTNRRIEEIENGHLENEQINGKIYRIFTGIIAYKSASNNNNKPYIFVPIYLYFQIMVNPAEPVKIITNELLLSTISKSDRWAPLTSELYATLQSKRTTLLAATAAIENYQKVMFEKDEFKQADAVLELEYMVDPTQIYNPGVLSDDDLNLTPETILALKDSDKNPISFSYSFVTEHYKTSARGITNLATFIPLRAPNSAAAGTPKKNLQAWLTIQSSKTAGVYNENIFLMDSILRIALVKLTDTSKTAIDNKSTDFTFTMAAGLLHVLLLNDQELPNKPPSPYTKLSSLSTPSPTKEETATAPTTTAAETKPPSTKVSTPPTTSTLPSPSPSPIVAPTTVPTSIPTAVPVTTPAPSTTPPTPLKFTPPPSTTPPPVPLTPSPARTFTFNPPPYPSSVTTPTTETTTSTTTTTTTTTTTPSTIAATIAPITTSPVTINTPSVPTTFFATTPSTILPPGSILNYEKDKPVSRSISGLSTTMKISDLIRSIPTAFSQFCKQYRAIKHMILMISKFDRELINKIPKEVMDAFEPKIEATIEYQMIREFFVLYIMVNSNRTIHTSSKTEFHKEPYMVRLETFAKYMDISISKCHLIMVYLIGLVKETNSTAKTTNVARVNFLTGKIPKTLRAEENLLYFVTNVTILAHIYSDPDIKSKDELRRILRDDIVPLLPELKGLYSFVFFARRLGYLFDDNSTHSSEFPSNLQKLNIKNYMTNYVLTYSKCFVLSIEKVIARMAALVKKTKTQTGLDFNQAATRGKILALFPEKSEESVNASVASLYKETYTSFEREIIRNTRHAFLFVSMRALMLTDVGTSQDQYKPFVDLVNNFMDPGITIEDHGEWQSHEEFFDPFSDTSIFRGMEAVSLLSKVLADSDPFSGDSISTLNGLFRQFSAQAKDCGTYYYDLTCQLLDLIDLLPQADFSALEKSSSSTPSLGQYIYVVDLVTTMTTLVAKTSIDFKTAVTIDSTVITAITGNGLQNTEQKLATTIKDVCSVFFAHTLDSANDDNSLETIDQATKYVESNTMLFENQKNEVIPKKLAHVLDTIKKSKEAVIPITGQYQKSYKESSRRAQTLANHLQQTVQESILEFRRIYDILPVMEEHIKVKELSNEDGDKKDIEEAEGIIASIKSKINTEETRVQAIYYSSALPFVHFSTSLPDEIEDISLYHDISQQNRLYMTDIVTKNLYYLLSQLRKFSLKASTLANTLTEKYGKDATIKERNIFLENILEISQSLVDQIERDWVSFFTGNGIPENEEFQSVDKIDTKVIVDKGFHGHEEEYQKWLTYLHDFTSQSFKIIANRRDQFKQDWKNQLTYADQEGNIKRSSEQSEATGLIESFVQKQTNDSLNELKDIQQKAKEAIGESANILKNVGIVRKSKVAPQKTAFFSTIIKKGLKYSDSAYKMWKSVVARPMKVYSSSSGGTEEQKRFTAIKDIEVLLSADFERDTTTKTAEELKLDLKILDGLNLELKKQLVHSLRENINLVFETRAEDLSPPVKEKAIGYIHVLVDLVIDIIKESTENLERVELFFANTETSGTGEISIALGPKYGPDRDQLYIKLALADRKYKTMEGEMNGVKEFLGNELLNILQENAAYSKYNGKRKGYDGLVDGEKVIPDHFWNIIEAYVKNKAGSTNPTEGRGTATKDEDELETLAESKSSLNTIMDYIEFRIDTIAHDKLEVNSFFEEIHRANQVYQQDDDADYVTLNKNFVDATLKISEKELNDFRNRAIRWAQLCSPLVQFYLDYFVENAFLLDIMKTLYEGLNNNFKTGKLATIVEANRRQMETDKAKKKEKREAEKKSVDSDDEEEDEDDDDDDKNAIHQIVSDTSILYDKIDLNKRDLDANMNQLAKILIDNVKYHPIPRVYSLGEFVMHSPPKDVMTNTFYSARQLVGLYKKMGLARTDDVRDNPVEQLRNGYATNHVSLNGLLETSFKIFGDIKKKYRDFALPEELVNEFTRAEELLKKFVKIKEEQKGPLFTKIITATNPAEGLKKTIEFETRTDIYPPYSQAEWTDSAKQFLKSYIRYYNIDLHSRVVEYVDFDKNFTEDSYWCNLDKQYIRNNFKLFNDFTSTSQTETNSIRLFLSALFADVEASKAGSTINNYFSSIHSENIVRLEELEKKWGEQFTNYGNHLENCIKEKSQDEPNLIPIINYRIHHLRYAKQLNLQYQKHLVGLKTKLDSGIITFDQHTNILKSIIELYAGTIHAIIVNGNEVAHTALLSYYLDPDSLEHESNEAEAVEIITNKGRVVSEQIVKQLATFEDEVNKILSNITLGKTYVLPTTLAALVNPTPTKPGGFTPVPSPSSSPLFITIQSEQGKEYGSGEKEMEELSTMSIPVTLRPTIPVSSSMVALDLTSSVRSEISKYLNAHFQKLPTESPQSASYQRPSFKNDLEVPLLTQREIEVILETRSYDFEPGEISNMEHFFDSAIMDVINKLPTKFPDGPKLHNELDVLKNRHYDVLRQKYSQINAEINGLMTRLSDEIGRLIQKNDMLGQEVISRNLDILDALDEQGKLRLTTKKIVLEGLELFQIRGIDQFKILVANVKSNFLTDLDKIKSGYNIDSIAQANRMALIVQEETRLYNLQKMNEPTEPAEITTIETVPMDYGLVIEYNGKVYESFFSINTKKMFIQHMYPIGSSPKVSSSLFEFIDMIFLTEPITRDMTKNRDVLSKLAEKYLAVKNYAKGKISSWKEFHKDYDSMGFTTEMTGNYVEPTAVVEPTKRSSPFRYVLVAFRQNLTASDLKKVESVEYSPTFKNVERSSRVSGIPFVVDSAGRVTIIKKKQPPKLIVPEGTKLPEKQFDGNQFDLNLDPHSVYYKNLKNYKSISRDGFEQPHIHQNRCFYGITRLKYANPSHEYDGTEHEKHPFFPLLVLRDCDNNPSERDSFRDVVPEFLVRSLLYKTNEEMTNEGRNGIADPVTTYLSTIIMEDSPGLSIFAKYKKPSS